MVPFGSAGDCFSANEDPTCRKGSFMIDLSGSGLKISSSVSWKMQQSINLKIAEFQNDKGIRVSGKCGGWCGHCKPTPSLTFEMSGCSLDTSKCYCVPNKVFHTGLNELPVLALGDHSEKYVDHKMKVSFWLFIPF